MRLFARHSLRRYVSVSVVTIICTIFVVSHLQTEPAGDQSVDVQRLNRNSPRPPQTALSNITDQGREWRKTNRVVLEYNADVARRMKELAEHQTPADHPDTVRLAQDLLDLPPDNPDGVKHARYIVKTPQAQKVDEITQNMRGGFFVECGALDGERSSNTLYLERDRGWTGLLIEMDPYFYTQLLGKNRNVWSINACLSPYKYVTALPFRGDDSGAGRLLLQQGSVVKRKRKQIVVPCFPLETLLLAINVTRIDYLSLDVEGVEMPILRTIPWNRLDIRVMSVEYGHGPNGKTPYLEFMKSVGGYAVYADIHYASYEKALFVEDFIFVKNSSVAASA